jgi:hypothetical protein
MISCSLVDVKNITSDVPRSKFVEAELDNLADIILETGGIIKPLVVKMAGAENYTLIDGHLEYYAAVRAREKDSRKGEMVNAFIISPKNEQIVKKQAEAIRGFESVFEQAKTIPANKNLESRLTNIELRVEKQINELRSEYVQGKQYLENKLKEIESKIPQRIEPLNLLNTLTKDELTIQLQRSRISGAEKIAKAIVDVRQKKQTQEFENYRDVVKSVKGLGETTILTIIDDWSRS